MTKGRATGWTLSQVGDAALVVEYEQRIDPAINAKVLAVAEALRKQPRAGVRDVVESYCAVTVHYDPLRTDVAQVMTDLEAEVERVERDRDDPTADRRQLTVPVCYGGDHGPDLAGVAAFAGCSQAAVVNTHTSTTYRVYMLGFLPGFAYMGAVAPAIAIPRRSVPRLDVPAGSVGIAASQTGVYPICAPGGWQLIGRTPLTTFDLDRTDPFFFRPGDAVQFEAISSERFDEIALDG